MTFGAPDLAFVRAVPESFPRCLRSGEAAPEVGRARAQHAAYVAALRGLGVAVIEVAADEAYPDCCFIEDTAVLADGRGVITRPGAPSRVGEREAVAGALAPHVELVRMAAPARLDGGDVMRVGAALFVGLSSRSDRAGAESLAAATGLELHAVPVAAGLHLKSAVTIVGDRTVIADLRAIDAGPLRAAGLEVLPAGEGAGGNVLAVGEHLLVSAAAPGTAAMLAARGYSLTTLDVSEFHKADGALTCLSLRRAPAGCWCA